MNAKKAKSLRRMIEAKALDVQPAVAYRMNQRNKKTIELEPICLRAQYQELKGLYKSFNHFNQQVLY